MHREGVQLERCRNRVRQLRTMFYGPPLKASEETLLTGMKVTDTGINNPL